LVEYILANIQNKKLITDNKLYKFVHDKDKRLNPLIAFKKDELVHYKDKSM